MVRRSWVGVCLAVGLAAGTVAGCGDDGAPGAGAEPEAEVESRRIDPSLATRLPADASFESAEEGRALFAPCATCHGFEGDGTQLGPSLQDTVWIQPGRDIAAIEEVIRTGVAEPAEFPVPMPPQGGGLFTDEQIRALATYVYLLGQG